MKIYLLPLLLVLPIAAAQASDLPSRSSVDAAVHKVMAKTAAKGMALAIIDGGKVRYVQAYGMRNARNEPLRMDTVMYGASLTKVVFAYTVLQLVDQKKLSLDTPLADYLDKPLTDYDTNAI